MTVTTSRHEGEEFADLTIRWDSGGSLIIGASYDRATVSSVAYGADLKARAEITSLFTRALKDHPTIEALDLVAASVGGITLSRKAKAKVKTRSDAAFAYDGTIELPTEFLAALT